MDFDDHRADAIDKLMQATFGLWNALLTVNGIMLTVFSALYAVGPQAGQGVLGALIGLCVVSACLLVFNHWAMKSTYHPSARSWPTRIKESVFRSRSERVTRCRPCDIIAWSN